MITEYIVILRTVTNSVEYGGDEMRKRNGITNGGGRSQMSRHVRRNADVSVVTGGRCQSGGRQPRDPASGPGGGCHKTSF